MLDVTKLVQLGINVYNEKKDMVLDEATNKYVAANEGDIKALCERVFGDGTLTPDPSMLHSFNNILVQTADAVAEPTVKEVVSLLADYKTVKPGETVVWDVPQTENKPFYVFSATGATADLVRITQEKKFIPAIKSHFDFGIYYNTLDFVQDSVDQFNRTINNLAEAKIKTYYKAMIRVIDKAIATGDIPAKNNLLGSGLTLADFKQKERRFTRWGGRPILVADQDLIQELADQEVQVNSPDRTSELVNERRELLQIQKVSKTICMNLNNPYIDMAGTKTQFPINTGYMLAGALNGKKPIQIAEYGGMKQDRIQDGITGRVSLQVSFDAAVNLIYGRLIGKVFDEALVDLE